MEKGEEIDQFGILEKKVESLIEYVSSFQREKETLAEKIHIMEEKVADTGAELQRLRSARDQAKKRIVTLLEKIEQLGV